MLFIILKFSTFKMLLHGNDRLKEMNLFESKLKTDKKLFGKLIYQGPFFILLKVLIDSWGKDLEKRRCSCAMHINIPEI